MVRAYALASRVHGPEFTSRVYREFSRLLEELGVKLEGLVTSEDEARAVKASRGEVLVLAILSGGASRLARLIAKGNRDSPLLLLSQPYHNSLASALSAKSRLEVEGYRVALAHVERVESSPPAVLEWAVKAARAYERLAKLKVLHFDVDSKPEEAKLFERVFGGEVVVYTRRDSRRLLEEQARESEGLVEELAGYVDLTGVERRLLTGPLALYAALRRAMEEVGANAVTVDCFPFIMEYKFTPCIAFGLLLSQGVPAACEADYRSLALLAASYELSGRPGWIFNPSDYCGGMLVGSHCTAAPVLALYSTLVPHFETGNPYAIAASLEPGTYTMAAISPDFKRLASTRVELRESGMLSGGRCRTQAVLEVASQRKEGLLGRMISNHHVLIPGYVGEALEYLASLSGLEYLEY